jgi:hypothetical protein
MQAKLGPPKVITAAAHKLARIIFHLLSTREPYDESTFSKHELQHRHRNELRLRNHARKLGFDMIPIPTTGNGESVPQDNTEITWPVTIRSFEQKAADIIGLYVNPPARCGFLRG